MDQYEPIALRPEDEIPILDLGPYLAGEKGALEALAKQLRHASTEVGFYFVKNHGIAQPVIDQVFGEAKRFHDQPIEAKRALGIDKHKIGYQESKSHVMKHSKLGKGAAPDLNAGLCMRRELAPDHPDVLAGKPYRAANRWPANLPGLRENVLVYMNGLENLAFRLLPVIARALDMPADFFNAAFANPLISMRLNHYPDQPVFDGKQFGIAPHTDRSFITILCQAQVPGLEIGTTDGRWAVAPALPGHFLVNTGDLLRHWTNDVFLSTPHRVINVSRGERFSIPFFYFPDTDVRIEAIPSCVTAAHPAKYPPTTVLDFYDSFVKSNYAAVAAEQAKAEAHAR